MQQEEKNIRIIVIIETSLAQGVLFLLTNNSMVFRCQVKNDNTKSSKGVRTGQWLLKLWQSFYYAYHVNA